jgi:hypothetical protein
LSLKTLRSNTTGAVSRSGNRFLRWWCPTWASH